MIRSAIEMSNDKLTLFDYVMAGYPAIVCRTSEEAGHQNFVRQLQIILNQKVNLSAGQKQEEYMVKEIKQKIGEATIFLSHITMKTIQMFQPKGLIRAKAQNL